MPGLPCDWPVVLSFAPSSNKAARITARAAPPAPIDQRRAGIRAPMTRLRACLKFSRNPKPSVLLTRTESPSWPDGHRVDGADPSARSDPPSIESIDAATPPSLWGMVTLQPRKPKAGHAAQGPFPTGPGDTAKRQIGTVDVRSVRSQWPWSCGEREWPIGQPITPAIRCRVVSNVMTAAPSGPAASPTAAAAAGPRIVKKVALDSEWKSCAPRPSSR